jgi:two-component system sensor histidine kinase KdpD
MFVPKRKTGWIEYGVAFATFALVSLLNLWLNPWLGYQTIALVYLLAIVLLALFVGRGPILFGTALTAFGWSFIFAPPPYSFHIGSFYDKMMCAMYFVVALTVAHLMAGLRAERLAEQRREERSRALYLFTRELAAAADRSDILNRVIGQLGAVFNADIALLVPEGNPAPNLAVFPKSTWVLNSSERDLAMMAFQPNATGGPPIQLPAETEGLYLPLTAGGAPEGVLAVRLKSKVALTADQTNLLENFARQTALVLERQRLRDAEINNRLLVESERFSRTLLNSVSHELRTPLSAISAAAATLRDSGSLNPVQQKLSVEIDAATTRLNRVVQSLLSAARIQSGQVRPNLDWCDVCDVVRAAFREVGTQLDNHHIEKSIEPGLPLIRADFTLLQQAVVNLLINAVTYTPAGTQIQVCARRNGEEIIVEVADHGPGLPTGQIERVFDLFHRAPGAKPGGTGLGLAIVKGFVEAQGGRVRAGDRAGGGAIFSIHLPVCEVPNLAEETV